MMNRIIILAGFLMIVLGGSLYAQQESYYGWIYEGEGTAKGFRLTIDPQKKMMLDTVEVLYSNIHTEVYPPPETTAGWKALFKKVTPFRIHMESYSLKNDSINFSLEKYMTGNDWFKITFTGALSGNSIKGVILQEDYIDYGGGNHYKDKYKIKFSK